MDTLWPTLVEFLLRLSTGLAAALVLVPARWVGGGFFRVHLWVLMGLGTFTSLAIYSKWEKYAEFTAPAWPFGLCVAAAVVSYLGAIVWMYEARRLGKAFMVAIAGLFCAAQYASLPHALGLTSGAVWGASIDFSTAAFLLGFFLAAMLLGHWYLNSPGMKLEPLRLLVALSALAIVLRAAFEGANLGYLATGGHLPTGTMGWSFIAFRWLAGLVLPLGMAGLTWQTLKIPNTQSATGILYAAVTLTFLGELTAQLLARTLLVPV
jgi:hypothetical protein